MNSIKHFVLIALASLFLVSCASKIKDDEKVVPATELYDAALTQLDKGEHKKAATGFEKIFSNIQAIKSPHKLSLCKHILFI